MKYLRAQVNFRQLRAETAGNRYLRRFLPASAGIFTCGSVYLRPSQVILHAPVLQCSGKLCASGKTSALFFSGRRSLELVSMYPMVLNYGSPITVWRKKFFHNNIKYFGHFGKNRFFWQKKRFLLKKNVRYG